MREVIFKYIRHFRRDFVYFTLLSGAEAMVSAPIPLIYKAVIDKIVSGTAGKVWMFLLIYVVLFILQIFLRYTKDKKLYTFQYDVAFKVNEDVFRKVLSLPYSILSRKDPGEWLKLVSHDATNLYSLLTFGIFNLISISLQLIVNLIILFLLYGWYVLLAIAVFPVYYLLIRKGVKNVEKYEMKLNRIREEWFADVYSPLNKLKEIKSRRIENFLVGKLSDSYDRVKNAGIESAISSNYLNHLFSFFDAFVYLAVFTSGIFLVISHKLTIGTLFATIYIMNSILSSFNLLSLAITNDIQLRIPSLKRLTELFNEKIPERNKIPPNSDKIEVEFKNVEFIYPNNPKFHLTIPQLKLISGKRYVLIGKTGAGKTTFFDLLSGIYFPDSGSILINGVDTREINETWWKDNVCVLLQDSSIFRGTIRENILIDEEDRDNRLEYLISKFGFERVFSRFKNYLDTSTMGGISFSGGEKRVINILRALFKRNAKIILIDEGTTGLDPVLREKYRKALYEASEGRLTVVITHDLDEISDFDEVLFVHNGSIIAGKHENLLTLSPEYRNFIQKEE